MFYSELVGKYLVLVGLKSCNLEICLAGVRTVLAEQYQKIMLFLVLSDLHLSLSGMELEVGIEPVFLNSPLVFCGYGYIPCGVHSSTSLVLRIIILTPLRN